MKSWLIRMMFADMFRYCSLIRNSVENELRNIVTENGF